MRSGILHTVVIVAGIISYTLLTITSHDGNTVLAAVLAYATGAGIEGKIPSKDAV